MKLAQDSDNINPSGKTSLDKSVFIWLDILGFADSLEDEKIYQDLFEMLSYFKSKFNIADSKYVASVISDGIILEIKSDKFSQLESVFEEIGKKQLEFILEKKTFIRGGISVGTKFKEGGISVGTEFEEGRKNHFISNGLSRAVKLESSYVDWPIIGTDKKNLEEINKLIYTIGISETFGFAKGFNKNGHDLYFIDFLGEKKDEYLNLIKEMFDKYTDENCPAIRNKYLWLIRYYQWKYGVIESFKDCIL